jgi:hypothetical protein
MTRRWIALLALAAALAAPAAASAAAGCCLILKPGESEATAPEDVVDCFPLQALSDCDLYKSQVPTAGAVTKWKGQSCSTVPACAGRAPASCCKILKGEATEQCIPADSDGSCRLYIETEKRILQQAGGDRYAISSKYVGGTACNLLTDCAGKIPDAAIYGAGPGPSEASAAPPAEIRPPPFLIPTLQYTIPSLAPFTQPGGSFKEGYEVPYLAQYITGIYGWALGAVTVLAIAMIVWGGFKWQTAGGNAERVGSAQGTIRNALIGLLIAMSSYLILWTLNPALVEFRALRITTVRGEVFPGPDAASRIAPGPVTPVTLTDEDKLPRDLTVPPASACPRTNVDQPTRDAAVRAAEATGVPAAVLLAQWSVESDNGRACIGDADGRNRYNCWGVKCVSGGKYEGRDVPVAEAGTRPECPSGCVSKKTTERPEGGSETVPFYACFQVFDSWEAAAASHAKAVQKGSWRDYAQNPVGFARFVQSIGYASGVNYADALVRRMRDECLTTGI